MMKLLQSGWMTMLLGTLSYLATTLVLLSPAKVRPDKAHDATGPLNSNRGVSWEFFNPELDRLITELVAEKKALAEREQQLNELATRLEAERAELNQITQAVHRLQVEFDRSVTRVRDDESANLKRLAKIYSTMAPEGAVAILKELDDDRVVKILLFLKEAETAPLLEALARLGPAEAKRAALISERLRTSSPPKEKAKP
jgi:flagellar motility protein MotE (MotC chaperone)